MLKRIISFILILIVLFSISAADIAVSVSAKTNAPAAYWTPAISKSAQKKLDKRVYELIGNIPAELKSNYQKTLYAYMKFSEDVFYNMNELDSSVAYGALVNGWAQCDGMAAGLAYLLTKLNVPVKIVVSPAARHVWNLVKMDDGKWYHIDFLSDDKILFAGDKTMLKYNGSVCKDYYVCDGSDCVTAPKNDYTGGTKLYNSTVSLHKKIQDNSLYIVDGWFYYSEIIKFTQSEQKLYNKSSNDTYTALRRVRGNIDEQLLGWNDFSEIVPMPGGFDIFDVCGSNLYSFKQNDNDSDSLIQDCYKYNAETRSLTYEGKQTVKQIIGDIYKDNIYYYSHSVKKLKTETSYGSFRTKNRIICADCGKVLYAGKRIKPNKITDYPKLKLSSKKSKRLTYSFTNRYYKLTSNLEWFKSRSGYEVAYRKKGTKRWYYDDYFTSKKNIKKSIKVNSKGKYEVKVRYYITYGASYYNYYRINHYGPWSKVKVIKVK